MEEFSIRMLAPIEFPALLRQIADQPKRLWVRGTLPTEGACRFLTVVGSRNYSSYGKAVVDRLIAGLTGYPVCIVSGLALGIDRLAHEAALEARLPSVAVPGSGLSDTVLYPRQNCLLAHRILESGGALLSEFDPDFRATAWSFPRRNRIMAGLSHATLVIEGGAHSGTLITASLALDYNRDVLTVPGDIFSSATTGPHSLLKNGAALIQSSEDILEILGISVTTRSEDAGNSAPLFTLSKEEMDILTLLTEPLTRNEIVQRSTLTISSLNVLISSLQLKNIIGERADRLYRI